LDGEGVRGGGDLSAAGAVDLDSQRTTLNRDQAVGVDQVERGLLVLDRDSAVRVRAQGQVDLGLRVVVELDVSGPVGASLATDLLVVLVGTNSAGDADGDLVTQRATELVEVAGVEEALEGQLLMQCGVEAREDLLGLDRGVNHSRSNLPWIWSEWESEAATGTLFASPRLVVEGVFATGFRIKTARGC